MNYIFITGGVCSGMGKGILAASVGRLLSKSGWNIVMNKYDPYLQGETEDGKSGIDSLNPEEHGEVYVLSDGTCADLDLGHYKRFTGCELNKLSTSNQGSIYQSVIKNSLDGKYGGKTCQPIPQITDEIQRRFRIGSKENTIKIIEIGGTVGDYESELFLDAIRQFKKEENCVHIHLGLLPEISQSHEIKTKPMQHSCMALQKAGLFPDILVCRVSSLSDEQKDSISNKLSLFCNIKKDNVIFDEDSFVYNLPYLLNKQNLTEKIYEILNLENNGIHKIQQVEEIATSSWFRDADKLDIAIIGKYSRNTDAYKSVIESVILSGIKNNVNVTVNVLDSEQLEKFNDDFEFKRFLRNYDGFIIAGGFGSRGIYGKVKVINYARENKVPILGICLGFQLMTLEYASNVLNLYVGSREFDNKLNELISCGKESTIDTSIREYIIDYQPGLEGTELTSGTMRLGSYDCNIVPETKLENIYKDYAEEHGSHSSINKIHRHRFEMNKEIYDFLEFKSEGMILSGFNIQNIGTSNEHTLIEAIELKDHPFFVGVQYHPEMDTTIDNPEPLFIELVKEAISYRHPIKLEE